MNKTATSLVTLAVLTLLFSFLLNGTGCQSMVRVQVPTGMMAAFGAARTISLNESDGITQQWRTFVIENTKQWEANLDQAWFVWGILSSLGNMGLESLQSLAVGGIPIGGLLVTLLGFGGGLSLTKPGDKRKLSEREAAAEARGKALAEAIFKQKIDSFNAGLERNGGKPTKMPVPPPAVMP